MEMEPLQVSGPGTWVSPEIGISLSEVAVREAVAWCAANLTEPPSMLLVHPMNVDLANRIVYVILDTAWREALPSFSILDVNGLPRDAWVVCGPSGGVICGGA